MNHERPANSNRSVTKGTNPAAPRQSGNLRYTVHSGWPSRSCVADNNLHATTTMTDKEKELMAQALAIIKEATLNFGKLADMSHLCILAIKQRSEKMRDLCEEIEKEDPGFLTKNFRNQPPPRTQ